MVVFDPAAGSCEIYEIKQSTEAVPQQYRHLIDDQKCELTQHRFGPITGKYVLYRARIWWWRTGSLIGMWKHICWGCEASIT